MQNTVNDNSSIERKKYLCTTQSDMNERGIEQLDFVFVSGDGYVDHPSFAAALLGRLLESHGYTVGIIAQPDWNDVAAFQVLGRPKLAFLVSAGAMDSMVSNYTANNKPRSEDYYAHGGEKGHRPDRALITYCTKIRQAYKGVSIIIGGIEASLRRTSHYDYWSDTVRRSVLLDSKADLLLYGMGEHALVEIAQRLANGETASTIRGVRGTCWRCGKASELPGAISGSEKLGSAAGSNSGESGSTAGVVIHERNCDRTPIFLPSFEEVSARTEEGKRKFAESYITQEQNTDAISARVLIERCDTRFVVQEPPALPLSTKEFDDLMELPFTRTYHPMYEKKAANGKNGIPALQEVQFSLTSVRGCFGACSFCAITFHQGRRIQARSHESLVREATLLTKLPDFKGYIHDVGGPTANFRQDACEKQKKFGACTNRDCLGTNPCPNLKVDHSDYVSLLTKLRAVPNVKKVFIRSGIRFDYLMMDKDKTFFYDLCKHHISGQLKVAPEHVSDKVLGLMRKSQHCVYEKFVNEYEKINKELGKKQYLVPYMIASHPGATLEDALEQALFLKKTGFVPDQVQDFYPTPGSLATAMYYTELDPRTMNRIHVAKGAHERRLHRALLQFNKSENRKLVIEALEKIGRKDLIKTLLH